MTTEAEPIFITFKFKEHHLVVRVAEFPAYDMLKTMAVNYFPEGRGGNISLKSGTVNYLIASEKSLKDLIDFGAFTGNKFTIEIEAQRSVFDAFRGAQQVAQPQRHEPFSWNPNPNRPPFESYTPQVHVFGSWSQPQN